MKLKPYLFKRGGNKMSISSGYDKFKDYLDVKIEKTGHKNKQKAKSKRISITAL